MPLFDHFHEPGVEELYWGSIGGAWAVALMGWLNRTLPRDEYRAFANMYLGPKVEADVAEFERRDAPHGERNGAVATEVAPPAIGSIAAVFPDDAEVLIRDETNRLRLAGVIELVSPGNKKEANERDAFVSKCASYLQKGIGVVVVDVVTSRLANLHNLLMARIGGASPPLLPTPCPTYAVGYHPVHLRTENANRIDIWPYPLVVGKPLPAVPLGLRGGPVVMLDLEATYTAAIEATGL